MSACREAVSHVTQLVGSSDTQLRMAERHVAACDQCQSVLGRSGSVAVRPRRFTDSLRWVLALVATCQFVIALPWLFGSNWFSYGHVAEAQHLTRDGALGLVIAICGLAGAWRTRWCAPLALVGLGLLAVQTAAGAVDQSAGRVSLYFESMHALLLIVVGLLLMLAVTARTRLSVEPIRRGRHLTLERTDT